MCDTILSGKRTLADKKIIKIKGENEYQSLAMKAEICKLPLPSDDLRVELPTGLQQYRQPEGLWSQSVSMSLKQTPDDGRKSALLNVLWRNVPGHY